MFIEQLKTIVWFSSPTSQMPPQLLYNDNLKEIVFSSYTMKQLFKITTHNKNIFTFSTLEKINNLIPLCFWFLKHIIQLSTRWVQLFGTAALETYVNKPESNSIPMPSEKGKNISKVSSWSIYNSLKIPPPNKYSINNLTVGIKHFVWIHLTSPCPFSSRLEDNRYLRISKRQKASRLLET